MIKPRDFDLSVYFVVDPSVCRGRSAIDIVKQVVAGGVTMVQLRDKSGSFTAAQAIRDFLKPLRVPFIINDNVDVAMAVDADGVHLGQEDMNPAKAREILGPGKIIGVTAFEEAHFKNIDPAVVDYAGTGPFYATLTKPDKKILGPEGFRKLVSLSPVPVVGIGGIKPDNAGAVIHCGAAGVAMMRGISENRNPKQAAQDFVKVIKHCHSERSEESQALKHGILRYAQDDKKKKAS